MNKILGDTNKGITLIALVITIIVLLILAGVTIAMLMGENGILSKANEASENTKKANTLEKVQMEVAGMFKIDGTTKYDMNEVKEEISNKLNIEKEEIVENNNSLYFKYNGYQITINQNGKVKCIDSVLPEIYQQVEYIESTGTQYIDTGVIGRSGQIADAKFEYTSISGSTAVDTALLGCRGASIRYYFYLVNNRQFLIGYNRYEYTGVTCSPNKVYDASVKLSKNLQTLTIDNELKKSYTYSDEIDIGLDLYIFALNYSNTPISYGNAKLYELEIYEDNKIVRDFIPCYDRSNNEIGLYDTIEGKFYKNSGTGVFIKGRDIM